MSSWAVTVYGGEERPFDDGLCFGREMVQASYVAFWISLGFFFLYVSLLHLRLLLIQTAFHKISLSAFQAEDCPIGISNTRVKYDLQNYIFDSWICNRCIQRGRVWLCCFIWICCDGCSTILGVEVSQAAIARRNNQQQQHKPGSSNIPVGIGRHFITTWRVEGSIGLLSRIIRRRH